MEAINSADAILLALATTQAVIAICQVVIVISLRRFF